MRIDFHTVSKSFDRGGSLKRVLDDVSWSAVPGRISGVLGPNGAGKTTMIRILLNMLRADAGAVVIDDGRVERTMESFRHSVGYLPEERALYKATKVGDTITYFGMLKGLSHREAGARARRFIEMLDLGPYVKTKNSELSKGLSQRVQLACCLIHEPKILILDEPFYGLDPVNTQIVRDLLITRKNEGATILLCTHQMKEVEVLCDQIVMLSVGRVALSGDVGEIRAKYSKNEFLLDPFSQPEGLPSVEEVVVTSAGKLVRLAAQCSINELMSDLVVHKRPIQRLERTFTPLEEIFVSIVKGNHS